MLCAASAGIAGARMGEAARIVVPGGIIFPPLIQIADQFGATAMARSTKVYSIVPHTAPVNPVPERTA